MKNRFLTLLMIAAIEGLEDEEMRGLEVYINDELVGVAMPIAIANANAEVLYFLTIQSNQAGTLDFRTTDGARLSVKRPVVYESDSHWGSLEEPLILTPANKGNAYKIIENNNVLIIRNNEKYDVTGKKL